MTDDETSSIVSSFLGTDVTEFVTDRYGFTGGSQFTSSQNNDVTAQKTREREMKWLEMFSSWPKWTSKNFLMLKKRCRKGIPSSLRGRAWQYLSGSKYDLDLNPGKYRDLLQKSLPPQVKDDIIKDLHRQFPFHEMFARQGGTGQQDLYDVLHAYAVYKPEDGYCQAQAPVAAVILMHMPAEEAFWCLVAVMTRYIDGYYSPGLTSVQMDCHVLQGLFRKVSPVGFRHLRRCSVEPLLYCQEWLMCLFSRTLPWRSVLRLWDMFFCEGIKVIFRCSLVILKHRIGTSTRCRALHDMYDTLQALRQIDTEIVQPERIIVDVINLKLSESDIEKEFRIQQRSKKQHEPDSDVITRCYRIKPANNIPKSSQLSSDVIQRATTSSSTQNSSKNSNKTKKSSSVTSSSSVSTKSTVELKKYTPLADVTSTASMTSSNDVTGITN